MNDRIFRFVLLLVCLVSASFMPAIAVHTVDDVPDVQITDRSRYLSDPDGIISPEAVRSIDDMIARIRTATTVEMAVVVVDDIDIDEDSFATELYEKWGIGKEDKDNGLLVLVVRDRRRAVIRTGYGVEGVIPDVVASRIIRDDMAPYFADGDYDTGLMRAVEHIGRILEDPSVADELRSSQPDAVSRGGKDEDLSFTDLLFMWACLGVFLTIVLGVVAASRYAKVRQLRPNDKYVALAPLKGVGGVVSILGMGIPLLVYLPVRRMLYKWREAPRACSNCGSVMHKLDEQTDNQYLTPSQDLEEKINSVDYDVWLCPRCGETDIYPFVTENSGYTECEQCHAIACRHSCDKVVVKPTVRSVGHGVHEYTCLSCRHITRRPYIIPQLPDPTSAVVAAGILSSIVGRGGRGGGFGGGFTGGGFGGGSTGGGGASGGW